MCYVCGDSVSILQLGKLMRSDDMEQTVAVQLLLC